MTKSDARLRRAIGLDVGGTKIAGGVVDGAGGVIERISDRPAPTFGKRAVVRALLDVIAELTRRHHVDAIGIGAAGLVDWPEGRIRWSPNNGYTDLPLRRVIEDSTGLPTAVDNDANVAAWAEANAATEGLDRDYSVMLTVGTGLGGGFILAGEIFRGSSGVAAEVGHMFVDSRSREICSCGNNGCLESLASGTALGRAGRLAAEAEPHGLLARLGGGPDGVSGLVVRQAANLGDPTALALFERLGYWLGVGAATLTTLLDLRSIIVGGGLVAAGDLFLPHMRSSLERHIFARQHRILPEIASARLGSEAGWIGAGMLSLHELYRTESNGADVRT
ncbi:ROK family protein [Nocardia xishanensis]